MTKLCLPNKTWELEAQEIQEHFLGVFRVGMPDTLRILFLQQTVSAMKKLYGL